MVYHHSSVINQAGGRPLAAALTDSKSFSASLLRHSPHPIIVINPDTSIRYVNPALERLTGFLSAEVVGQRIPYPWWPAEMLEAYTREFVRAMPAGTEQEERLFQTKYGERFWVKVFLTPVHSDGRLQYRLINWMNITRRKAAERALRESEWRYRNLFNESRDAVYITTREGRFLDLNQASLDIFGYTREEMLALDVHQIYAQPADRVRFQGDIELHGSVKDYPVQFRRKDGTVIDCLLTATVWRDEHGDISGYHGIIRDITEQKRIERELLAYQRKLRSLSSQLLLAEERQRRQIAVGLHDGIGQALAMVKIKLAVLQNRLSSGADGGLLEEVSGLIEKTITEARSLVFELSPPILYELGLEAAVDWLVEQMKTRYAINYQFVDDNRPKPLADDVRVLLFQTVRELLMNVAKHARAQHVVVSMCGDGDNIRITVTDDGVGFDTGELQSHPERGNAFGLFSIRERMSFVGGHIEISSEPGHGSQVVAVAPLKKGRVSPRREHHECQNHHCR